MFSYNQGRDGYNMGRDGYNIGRDGYNDGVQTGSPAPEGSRPGTPPAQVLSPRPNRRPTLTPIPGVRPGIQVTHGRGTSICSHRAREGMYTPSDMSDLSSWDSELDGPDSDDFDSDGDEDVHQHFFEHRSSRNRYEEEEDEFERDPWNAVCVLGLRVYSKDTDVTIEVRNGDRDYHYKRSADGDDVSVVGSITTRKEKELDVDDSAADATSPLRTKGKLDAALAEKAMNVGNAPAGHELDRSGTLS